MLEKRLFDHPDYWEEFAAKYQFPTLAELGLEGCNSFRAEVVEPPRELRVMESLIKEFWADYSTKSKEAWNGSTYGIRGLPDVEKNGRELVVRVFPIDYATTVFSGERRGEKWTSRLSSSQLEFLSNIATLGIVNLVESQLRYLLGIKSGTRITGGLWETLATGLVESTKLKDGEDPFLGGTRKELEAETGLNFRDVIEIKPFGFSIGMRYGDFDLVSNITVKDYAPERIVVSDEHDYAAFLTLLEIAKIPRHRLNPVTFGVLKKMKIYDG